jgi:hypothetical protein
MSTNQEILKLIQSHKALEPFDYKLTVDWAIDLIKQGNETDDILILASFSEPIQKEDISPYVSAVLKELGLKELSSQNALMAQTHFYLLKILTNNSIREHLQSLSQLCLNNDYESELMNFYLLHHAWDELEEIGVNYYFDGADLNNIEEKLKDEAIKWIDKNINGKKNEE